MNLCAIVILRIDTGLEEKRFYAVGVYMQSCMYRLFLALGLYPSGNALFGSAHDCDPFCEIATLEKETSSNPRLCISYLVSGTMSDPR